MSENDNYNHRKEGGRWEFEICSINLFETLEVIRTLKGNISKVEVERKGWGHLRAAKGSEQKRTVGSNHQNLQW